MPAAHLTVPLQQSERRLSPSAWLFPSKSWNNNNKKNAVIFRDVLGAAKLNKKVQLAAQIFEEPFSCLSVGPGSCSRCLCKCGERTVWAGPLLLCTVPLLLSLLQEMECNDWLNEFECNEWLVSFYFVGLFYFFTVNCLAHTLVIQKEFLCAREIVQGLSYLACS